MIVAVVQIALLCFYEPGLSSFCSAWALHSACMGSALRFWGENILTRLVFASVLIPQ